MILVTFDHRKGPGPEAQGFYADHVEMWGTTLWAYEVDGTHREIGRFIDGAWKVRIGDKGDQAYERMKVEVAV